MSDLLQKMMSGAKPRARPPPDQVPTPVSSGPPCNSVLVFDFLSLGTLEATGLHSLVDHVRKNVVVIPEVVLDDLDRENKENAQLLRSGDPSKVSEGTIMKGVLHNVTEVIDVSNKMYLMVDDPTGESVVGGPIVRAQVSFDDGGAVFMQRGTSHCDETLLRRYGGCDASSSAFYVACALFFTRLSSRNRQASRRPVFLVIHDENLAEMANAAGVETIPFKDLFRWSSR